MKGKKVLITSGGCLEKWDQVRGHTNMAKGTIGRIIAEELISKGAHVIYLHGYFAEKPNDINNQLELHPFEGIIDLRDKMKSIITHEKSMRLLWQRLDLIGLWTKFVIKRATFLI